MKKTLMLIITIMVLVLIVVCMFLVSSNRNIQQVKENNNEYNVSIGKELMGIDVTTIINKAMDSNKKNQVKKDENGLYIENDINSIKIELIMIGENEKKVLQMETIEQAGITTFIKYFNLINFRCSNIEYHNKTKFIKKIVFEQIEE